MENFRAHLMSLGGVSWGSSRFPVSIYDFRPLFSNSLPPRGSWLHLGACSDAILQGKICVMSKFQSCIRNGANSCFTNCTLRRVCKKKVARYIWKVLTEKYVFRFSCFRLSIKKFPKSKKILFPWTFHLKIWEAKDANRHEIERFKRC